MYQPGRLKSLPRPFLGEFRGSELAQFVVH